MRHGVEGVARVGAEEISGVIPWIVSGKSSNALRAQAEKLWKHVTDRPGERPADIGLSLATTRARLGHRAVVLGTDRGALLDSLASFTGSGTGAPVVSGVAPGGEPRTVFVFPAQGSRGAAMAAELPDQSPGFTPRITPAARPLPRFLTWDPIVALA